jgi:hypothetical protein
MIFYNGFDSTSEKYYYHVMKSHISATIDERILEDLNRFGAEERRSRSQIIEMALEEFLHKRGAAVDEIVTSKGCFAGNFSREDTYER